MLLELLRKLHGEWGRGWGGDTYRFPSGGGEPAESGRMNRHSHFAHASLFCPNLPPSPTAEGTKTHHHPQGQIFPPYTFNSARIVSMYLTVSGAPAPPNSSALDEDRAPCGAGTTWQLLNGGDCGGIWAMSNRSFHDVGDTLCLCGPTQEPPSHMSLMGIDRGLVVLGTQSFRFIDF